MRDLKIKEVQVVQNVNGTEKIPVSNGSGQPAVITVNLILDKVDNKISEVIDGAPETLDTLKEIADIIENNADIIESVANKADKEDVYTKEELDNAIDVTYAELVALRDSELLRTGACYKITDYETMVDETPDYNELYTTADSFFKLVVRAISDKELDQRAFATDSSNPEYSNEILSKWQVWYSLDNDVDLYTWADANGKGVIYRLIDERNNDVNFDFKSIKFYMNIHNKLSGLTTKLFVKALTELIYTDTETAVVSYDKGENNIIIGMNNVVSGNYNKVLYTNSCVIIGNRTYIKGGGSFNVKGDDNHIEAGGSCNVFGNSNVIKGNNVGGVYIKGNNNINFGANGDNIIGNDNHTTSDGIGGNNITGNNNRLDNCGGTVIKGSGNKLKNSSGSPITGSNNIVSEGYVNITGDLNKVENASGNKIIGTGNHIISSGSNTIEGDFNIMTGSTGNGSIKGNNNKVHNANVTIDGHSNDISGSGGLYVTGDYNKISGGSGGNTIKGNNNTITGTLGGNNITGDYNVATQANCTIVGNSNNVTNGGGHRVEGDKNNINANYSLTFGNANDVNSPDSLGAIIIYGDDNKVEPGCGGVTLGDSDSPFNNCRILTGTKYINVIDRLNRGGISNITINLPRQYPTSGSLEMLDVYPEKYGNDQHTNTCTITWSDNGKIVQYNPEDFELSKRRFSFIMNIPEDLVGNEIQIIGGLVGGDLPMLQRLFVNGKEVNKDYSDKSKSYYTFERKGQHTITVWFDKDSSITSPFSGNNYVYSADFTDTDFIGASTVSNVTSYSSMKEVMFHRTKFDQYPYNMCSNSPELIKASFIDVAWNTNCYLSNWFIDCPKLEEVVFKGETSNFINFIGMFKNCPKLNKIILDCNLSNVTYMDNMFVNLSPFGTLYYNGLYDFSRVLELLPSGWEAVDINGSISNAVIYNATNILPTIKDGIYIYDGLNYVNTSEWNVENNDSAIGVAIIDGANKFVVTKEDSSEYEIAWGDLTTGNYFKTAEEAKLDIDGATISSVLKGSDIILHCNNGYLGSAGEWVSVLNNLEAVNAALELIEGTPLNAGSYWTSTEYDAEQAWRITPSGLEPSTSLSMVRPFIALGAPLTTRVKLLELKVLSIPDTSNFATKDEIPTNYITEIPAEYVTEDELTAKGYLTEHQSLAGYALKSELPDTSNLATKDEIPTDYLTVIPEATIDTLGGVKKITVDTLADDADIATVVAAYNNLVNKLIESGLAATLLDA